MNRLPNAKVFLESFSTQFQRKIEPSVLIMNEKTPEKTQCNEAAIGFRNIVALSHIIQSWEDWIAYKSQFSKFKFSDYFDHYPIGPSKDGKYLIQHSPSVMGLDDYKRFKGQSSPSLSASNHLGSFDKELYSLLHKQWKRAFVTGNMTYWKHRVLFRSLEMAFQASRIPAANNSSIFDYGISLSLWVSAFEVLLHNKRHVNQKLVIEFLEKIPLLSKRNSKRMYWILRYKDRRKANILPKIGSELYRARNAFLHGNPVKADDIFFLRNPNGQSLIAMAPIVYKAILNSLYKPIPKNPTLKWHIQNQFGKAGFEGALNAAIRKETIEDLNET